MSGERTGVDEVTPSNRPHRTAARAGHSTTGSDAERAAAVRQALRADIEACGYYPELVEDAINLAVGEEELLDFVVHHQPTFTHDEVHRHITVLARTATRLIIGHTDDHPAAPDELSGGGDRASEGVMVSTSTESIPLDKIANVALTRVVPHPERAAASADAVETWLSIAWGGGARRIDLEPATCADPNCDADHGYTGTIGPDDLTMRMSAAADGAESARRLAEFGTTMQQLAGSGR